MKDKDSRNTAESKLFQEYGIEYIICKKDTDHIFLILNKAMEKYDSVCSYISNNTIIPWNNL